MPTPTTNFAIFDGLELITYTAASGPVISDAQAVRRPLTQSSQRNVERYVPLEATDVVFHIDAMLFDSVALAAGDSISDVGGANFSVVFVERQTLKNTIMAIGRPV